MRQTASGWWVPDKPPAPELPRRLDLSYDGYLGCAYTHPAEGIAGCAWCGPDKLSPILPPPWDILAEVTLR